MPTGYLAASCVSHSISALQFIASEGDTVTPGTKVAVISKSAIPNEAHVSPPEEASQKETPPPPPEEKNKVEEKSPKVEPVKKKEPKLTMPPLKSSPSEPLLPPKERERQVSLYLSHDFI